MQRSGVPDSGSDGTRRAPIDVVNRVITLIEAASGVHPPLQVLAAVHARRCECCSLSAHRPEMMSPPSGMMSPLEVRLTSRTVEVFAKGERIAVQMRGSGNGKAYHRHRSHAIQSSALRRLGHRPHPQGRLIGPATRRFL